MFCHITAVKIYQEMNLFTGEHLLNISCFKIYMHIHRHKFLSTCRHIGNVEIIKAVFVMSLFIII